MAKRFVIPEKPSRQKTASRAIHPFAGTGYARVSSDTATLHGESRVNTDTFRHGGCSPPRFSFLPPDRARQFHHRLAASRAGIPPERFFPTGTGAVFFYLPPARSPFRPGVRAESGPGGLFAFSRNRPVFRQTPHSIFSGPDNGHLWRQKTNLRFLSPP